MSGTDMIKVQKQIIDATNGNTMGLEDSITLNDFMAILPAAGASVAGTQVLVTRQTAPANPGSFVDLPAAYTAWNNMRTALIAAGVFV